MMFIKKYLKMDYKGLVSLKTKLVLGLIASLLSIAVSIVYAVKEFKKDTDILKAMQVIRSDKNDAEFYKIKKDIEYLKKKK